MKKFVQVGDVMHHRISGDYILVVIADPSTATVLWSDGGFAGSVDSDLDEWWAMGWERVE